MISHKIPREYITDIVAPACDGNPDIVEAFINTPRSKFMDDAFYRSAFKDDALPIGYGQTISKPSTVALMSYLLDLDKTHRVLEIGTGSGFQAAILGRLAGEVYTVERIPELHNRAMQTIRRMFIVNVRFKLDDGHYGWSENAPYDRIIATAGASELPDELICQLKIGGKLVIPLKGRITLYEKTEDGLIEDKFAECSFVDFVKD